MKLIVGLGNPGPEYEATRHNLGFRAVDEVARRHGVTFRMGPGQALAGKLRVASGEAMLAKPLTFMNLSGPAVAELERYYRVDRSDLLVVTDDVNLPMSRLRARVSGSAGGHRGLASVQSSLGTIEYGRLRIGVGRGDPRRDLADHVLARFSPDEAGEVTAAVERAADAIETFITDGLDRVMNRYNQEDAQAPRQDDEVG